MMHHLKQFLLMPLMAATVILFLDSCSSTPTASNVDENTFASVQIGTQLWMAENLNVSSFRNGDPILEAKTMREWKQAGEEGIPAWCYPNNVDKSNTNTKIYNWHAVSDSRGLSPAGWHIPSNAEWIQLTDYLGGEEVAGHKMKSSSGWRDYEVLNDKLESTGVIKSGNGSNESGFSAMPSVIRFRDGSFTDDEKFSVEFWTSTEREADVVYFRYLRCNFDNLFTSFKPSGRGMFVRCLKD